MSKIMQSKKVIFLGILLFTLVNRVSAAGVSIKSNQEDFSVGSSFLVDINLDTQNESINALEGELRFDESVLELKEIKDGNSQINFWVDKPKLTSDGHIFFSGITPGGLMGQDKFLFSVVFAPKKVGSSSVTISNLKVLKNDGRGTNLKTTISNFNFSVSNKEVSSVLENADSNKPEDFKIYIGQDKEIFSGKNFLIFSTQDKDSGIDHYEVKEGFWSDYKVGISPYLLEDQTLSKTLYVKAVDKKGNERVVSLSPGGSPIPYRLVLILGILLAVCIFTFKKIKLRL